jgi:ubiquinone/menaquinone biosynthesis C-methylase UbiE
MEHLAPTSGDRILDVGAGDGSKAALILRSLGGTEVYAVDPDEKKVASMKRDFPSIKGSVAGAESLPFPDSYFDKVYSTMAVHHYSNLNRGLLEIARVLKPGGSFVIMEVEPDSLMGRVFRFFGMLMGERMNMMNQSELEAKLESEAGFKAAESVELGSKYLIRVTRS